MARHSEGERDGHVEEDVEEENSGGASDVKLMRLQQMLNFIASLRGRPLRSMEMEEATSADTSYGKTELPDECERKEERKEGRKGEEAKVGKGQFDEESVGEEQEEDKEEEEDKENQRMREAKKENARQVIGGPKLTANQRRCMAGGGDSSLSRSANLRNADLNQLTTTDSPTPSYFDEEGNACHLPPRCKPSW
ncbi:unnamed protein product [Taenia asiatica]|uniref:Prothymosin alpha-like n=1 Tax=Taenia asiatica TaxID=60517 RepID=A0A0R3W6Z7_TAEAS|nr:unnamed protein product [Taenia asiatica]